MNVKAAIAGSLLLCGFVSVLAGIALIYPPAAFVVGGAVACWVGLFGIEL